MFAEGGKLKKIKHLIPIFPVYFIIITVSIAFTLYYALDPDYNSLKYLAVSIFYLQAIMVLVCHSLAMWTNPGQIIKNDRNNVNMNSEVINYRKDNHSDAHNALFCRKCVISRPERTHHCKVCNKCIYKMDHHCPWIANCVGLNNQKFFYQFLFYATFGDLLAFICLLTKTFNLDIQTKIGKKKFDSVGDIFYELREPMIIILGCLLAFSMTIAIGFLFAMQTRCIMLNFTTIEEKLFKNSTDNPWYNSSDKLSNMKLVLGNNYYQWFIPVRNGQDAYNMRPLSNVSLQNKYLSLTDSTQEYDEGIHITLNLQD